MDRVKVILPNGGYRVGGSTKLTVSPGTIFELEGEGLEVKSSSDCRVRIPFNLEAAKAGAPLVTRDGRLARFVAHVPEATSGYKVLAFIEGANTAEFYFEDGRYASEVGHSRDLFMAEKPKRTVWVNLFRGAFAYHFADEKSARNNAVDSKEEILAIAVPIEIDA